MDFKRPCTRSVGISFFRRPTIRLISEKECLMSIHVRVGSAPDNWGVWFPNDPKQIPWERFLSEAAAAGYPWIELGPPGYLPQDPQVLTSHLQKHGLVVTTGFVMHHLEDPELWPTIEKEVH